MSHQHHEGVSCDSCMKGNFRGRRYKCLICFDYDSCSTCYENGVTSNRHTTDHPMQCILTRSDFELFYGGENLPQDVPQSFTCPFCGKQGLTETGLQEHVSSEHSDSSSEVICAICASIPGGEANNVTDDFAAHLQLEHRTPRELEEPQTAIRGRRAPHPSRSSLSSSRSSRRSNQMQYSSSVGLTSLSPGSAGGSGAGAASGASARDMDPIAELLSQLSGVRRAANQSNSSQLQQLQMQLHLDRHTSVPGLARQGFAPNGPVNSANDRVPIERVIRRHPQQQHQSSVGSASNTNSSSQSVSHHQQHVNHLMAAASVAGNSDMPYIVLMDQNPNLNQLSVNSVTTGNNQANIFQSTSNQSTSSNLGRFLLSRCNETNYSESELSTMEISKADKSLFVQELILMTLAENASSHSSDDPVSTTKISDQLKLYSEQLVKSESESNLVEKSVAEELVEHKTDENTIQAVENVESLNPEPSDCEGIDTSEDVIISSDEKTVNRNETPSVLEVLSVTQATPPTAFRSSSNLPTGVDNISNMNMNLTVDPVSMIENSTTIMNANQSQQQQRLTSTSSLSNASVKNRNVSTSTNTGPTGGVVHPLINNSCQSTLAAASPQPHVQINPTSTRTSQSQSTWTGPTAVRRRTINSDHHTNRNVSRPDRTSGASASGPTHPLKRGLGQQQTSSPAPPQET